MTNLNQTNSNQSDVGLVECPCGCGKSYAGRPLHDETGKVVGIVFGDSDFEADDGGGCEIRILAGQINPAGEPWVSWFRQADGTWMDDQRCYYPTAEIDAALNVLRKYVIRRFHLAVAE